MTSAGGARARLGRVLLTLPEGVRERLLPGHAGYRLADVPAAFAPSGAPHTLLMGPANSAGQGHAWTRAIDALPDWAAGNIAIVGEDDPFHYPADVVVPAVVAARSTGWARRQERAAQGVEHVVVESLRPVLGLAHGADPVRQIQALRDAGVQVSLLWHGSDIRSPRRNAELEPWSPFADADDEYTRILQQQTDRAAATADALGLPEFVSTPDLLRDRPHAVWAPVVLQPAEWPAQAWAPSPRLRVLHAPSRRRLKGSELVLDMLQDLDAEGVISLTLAERVPHARMAELVRASDVVLDQFALGVYGVAALEAMASGRLVISHVARDVRATVEQTVGTALPVLEADADSLGDVLRSVAADPEPHRAMVEAGRGFVTELHDGRRSAAALTGAEIR